MDIHVGYEWYQNTGRFHTHQKQMEKQYTNCEEYSNFRSIGSDHRIVIATICLSLRSNVKQNKRKIYDWSTLIDQKISKEYSNTVKRIYNDLNT